MSEDFSAHLPFGTIPDPHYGLDRPQLAGLQVSCAAGGGRILLEGLRRVGKTTLSKHWPEGNTRPAEGLSLPPRRSGGLYGIQEGLTVMVQRGIEAAQGTGIGFVSGRAPISATPRPAVNVPPRRRRCPRAFRRPVRSGVLPPSPRLRRTGQPAPLTALGVRTEVDPGERPLVSGRRRRCWSCWTRSTCGWRHRRARTASTAAAARTRTRGTAAPRIATGTRLATRTTTSASGFRLPLRLRCKGYGGTGSSGRTCQRSNKERTEPLVGHRGLAKDHAVVTDPQA